MTTNSAIVWVFGSHTEAEASTKELRSRQFDIKTLTIVDTEEHVVEAKGILAATQIAPYAAHELADQHDTNDLVAANASKRTN